jgi:hypothetical protein
LRPSNRRSLAALAAAALLALAAASGGSGEDPAAGGDAPRPGGLTSLDAYTFHDEASGLTTILATTDLRVGRNRFAFILTDRTGLVRLPVVTTETYYYPSGYGEPREGPVGSGLASFEEFPLATRGVFVTEHEFDRAGEWGAEVSFPLPDGSVARTELPFTVDPRRRTPSVGERPPASVNRTLSDVGSIRELTTGSRPDPGLYQITIAEALDNGRPSVVVFASPAFCTTAVCGAQVEVVSELREQYDGRVDFIHIDLFANPHEIEGDLSRGMRNPVLDEWRIPTDEWTFVTGADGSVVGRYEGFSPRHELDRAIVAALAVR